MSADCVPGTPLCRTASALRAENDALEARLDTVDSEWRAASRKNAALRDEREDALRAERDALKARVVELEARGMTARAASNAIDALKAEQEAHRATKAQLAALEVALRAVAFEYGRDMDIDEPRLFRVVDAALLPVCGGVWGARAAKSLDDILSPVEANQATPPRDVGEKP
jgi:DNA repair exonuclease SbcCD ATPase subunit